MSIFADIRALRELALIGVVMAFVGFVLGRRRYREQPFRKY